MDLDYVKIIVTITLAIFGWVIGHFFTSQRDKQLKRRELSIEYLVNAYRILTNEVSHRTETDERSEKLENTLSDIQLFGTPKQVEFARQLAEEVAASGTFELDPLINNLRDNLRTELGLEPVNGNVKWLRFTNKK